jgi:hypothetical protein
MLVCADMASLQRLSPVAVICLKKLFWEIVGSVVSVFLQAELSLYCFLEQVEVYVTGGGGGSLTTKLSKMCIRYIKVYRLYDKSSEENHALI